MEKRVDDQTGNRQEVIRRGIEKFGRDLVERFKLSLAEEELQAMHDEYLYLTARSMLDAGVSEDKATNLIAKYWDDEGVKYREAERVVEAAKAASEREKNLNASSKAQRTETRSKKNRG